MNDGTFHITGKALKHTDVLYNWHDETCAITHTFTEYTEELVITLDFGDISWSGSISQLKEKLKQ